MKISTILFDLDGTLLPMDLGKFTKGYFGALSKKLIPYGYDPKQLIDSVWAGIEAMVMNDGTCSNEVAFWNKFSEFYGKKAITDKNLFNDFYENDFNSVKNYCGTNSKIPIIVDKLKKSGYHLVLATNPIFPATATINRIKWAGLNPDDFEMITTYENSNYCKPNLKYYQELIDKLAVDPKKCLMVGNDVTEDMIVSKLGINVFLLTDCLINKNNVDIRQYPNGGFDEFTDYLTKLNS